MRSVWLIAAMKRMLGLSSLCPRRVRQKLSGAATTVVSLGSVPDLEISSQLDRATVRKDHSDKARNRDSACVLGEYGASASSDSDVIVTVTMEVSPRRKSTVAQSAPAPGSCHSGHLSECGKLSIQAFKDQGSSSSATDCWISATCANASAIASSQLNGRNTSSGQHQSYNFSRVSELLVPANTQLLVDGSGQAPALIHQQASAMDVWDIRFFPTSNNINLTDIEIQEANEAQTQDEHEFETDNHVSSSGPEQGDGDAAAGPLLSDDTNDAYSHWYSDISADDCLTD